MLPRLTSLVALLLLGSFLFTGALAQENNNGALPDSTANGVVDAVIPNPRRTIFQWLSSAGNYDVLVALLSATGLNAELDRVSARYTLLAPGDSAFVTLARDLSLEDRRINATNTTAIVGALLDSFRTIAAALPTVAKPVDILRFHVIGSALTLQQLEQQGSVTPLFTTDGVQLTFVNSSVVDASGNATVSPMNVFNLNGWAHGVDRVLLPFNFTATKTGLMAALTPTPSPSVTPSVSVSPTMTPSPGSSMSPTPSASMSVGASIVPSPSATVGTSPAVSSAPAVGTEDGTDTDTEEGTGTGTGTDTDSGTDSDADTSTDPEESTSLSSSEDGEGSSSNDNDGDDDGVCFPAHATVRTADGSTLRMDQLAAGHIVRHSTEDLDSSSSRIFLFTHRRAKGTYTFARLSTACGPAVTLTTSHYLYANGRLTRAGAVAIGDELRTNSGNCAVTKVERVKAEGLYAPHSMHGDLVVDDVVVSGYSTAVAPRAAQALLAPLRWIASAGVREPLGSLLYDGADWALPALPRGQDRY